jgi:CRISPR-associated endonuclease/helicase Cas3
LVLIRGLDSTQRPLAVGRLRGGVLRDDGWARIPSQAAVITSTVDQLGSRLLFRSYGSSSLAAPIYAGLAGNDSLILLDEAHCAVPFLQTLRAIKAFRSSKWSEIENPTPFHATVLSATPPDEANGEPLEVFPGESHREQALTSDTLQRRLRVSKKALLKVCREAELSKDIAAAATGFVREGKQRVGIIVNRVGKALEVAKRLRTEAEGVADVGVLTGRIRPVERDLLIGNTSYLHSVLRCSEPQTPVRPLILVATQCIEFGADFNFDELVTECASLDALRQRFGRLDRLGTYGQSSAVIVVTDHKLKEDKPDPIYDDAIRRTWEFLKGVATAENAGTKHERQIVDFGISALAPLLPTGDELKSLMAPTPDAPILLPAHLDLFSQTAPRPHPDPTPDVFLHGKDRGTPEVRVVWRCDLPNVSPERWLELVSLCRPVVGEMLPVPLYRVRQWLRNDLSPDSSGDVQGAADESEDSPTGSTATKFLIWRGCKHSEVLTDAEKIRSGDVVVLPVESADAAATLGQLLQVQGFGRSLVDVWELAWQKTNRPPMLRLSRVSLAPWAEYCQPLQQLLNQIEDQEPNDAGELRELLENVRNWTPEGEDAPALPGWLRQLFDEVKDFRFRDIAQHPAGGLILSARPRYNLQEEPDLFAEDDDEPSEAPDEVTLKQHTADVKQKASELASACLGAESKTLFEHVALWHDVGKVDPRFQTVLRGGFPNSIEPLAKSPNLPRSREGTDSAHDAARLPDGFRHEMVSLQLAERSGVLNQMSVNWDLFLHLIASHHGRGRPFAPVCQDTEPPGLHAELEDISTAISAVERITLVPPHKLHSGVSDRFWRLTRRFGWWGLAYREAILRLADWYASANPRSGDSSE